MRPASPDDTIAVDDPIIVVEVLSPSTAAIDHGRKLSGYFSLPSVQHYMILDPDRRVVIHHKRGASDAIVLTNPIVVVEVFSPGTAAIDHGRKLSGYFSLPSVEHYLILDPERRVVIHHKRGQGGAIETRVIADGVAKLDPPGFEVAVDALLPAP